MGIICTTVKENMPMFEEKVRSLIEAVNTSTASYSEIARECGMDRSWVGRFARGEIPNPGVLSYEALDNAMKKLNRRKSCA